MPTKKQIQDSNAENFAVLLIDAKERYDFVEDIYTADGVWIVVDINLECEEFDTFFDAMNFLEEILKKSMPF